MIDLHIKMWRILLVLIMEKGKARQSLAEKQEDTFCFRWCQGLKFVMQGNLAYTCLLGLAGGWKMRENLSI
jgi:hypothetical protein